MDVTVHLPSEMVAQFGAMSDMPRRLIEAFAVENYRLGKLARHQVSQLLELDYWQTEALLAKHDAKRPYTLGDLEVDRAAMAGLREK